MPKKRSVSSSLRHPLWLVISFFALLLIFAILRLQAQSKDLLSARETSVPFLGKPKIAFLFLARRNLPLDFLWQSFFQNADVEKFSVYIHSTPGFVFDESTTKCAFFYGRQLSESVEVAWGESSMIEAEQLLLDAALQDPANQRFILISDSCVPMYNFSYIYNYVMSSSKSFVDSFLDTKEGRYNPKMLPTIPKDKWRKGSQWITLVRRHAEVVVDDDLVLPIFKRYCKRRPPLNLDGKMNHLKVVQKEHNCIPDEHYVQTLLSMFDLEDELERRTLTYTEWNQSATKMEGQAWHPITFKYTNASPQRINRLKGINHVYYETEYRTEWCQSNGTSVPCFLFARKFSRGAAMRLLSAGMVGPFDAATLLDKIK